MSMWNQQSQNQNYPYWGMQNSNYIRGPVYRADPIHGENAAWQFPIGGGEIWLPDADKDLIWWIKVDQNGNKNVIPFDVKPHQKEPEVNMNDLVARLAAVEEWINGKSNKSNAKRSNTNSAVAAPVAAVAE